MASNRTMSTEEIKKGLENIKKAQLEVLKQLRGDSFMTDPKPNDIQSPTNIRYNQSYQSSSNNHRKNSQEQINQNRQNIQINGNRTNKSQITNYYQKNIQNKQYDSTSHPKPQQSNLRPSSNQNSVRTNQSITQTSASGETYQALKRQFSTERQELKNKLTEISSKLNLLEKESSQAKSLPRIQQVEMNKQLKKLQQQNKQLELSLNASKQQIQDFSRTQKKLKSELELKKKQKTILETQIKSLKSQTGKQARAIKELQSQIGKYTHTIKELKEDVIKSQQSRVNMDVVMKEVKSISSSHDFMFNKLKESTTIDMTIVQKESDIQNSFTRLLEYFQTLSSSGSSPYLSVNHNNEEDNANGFSKNNKKSSMNQSRQLIKRSVVSESRAEQHDQLEYFVREIGSQLSRKQLNELIQQNQLLKKKLNQLNQQRANGSIIYRNDLNGKYPNELKYQSESKRLINLQLQDMRDQVAKFKKFKAQIKQDQEELEKQTIKFKLKAKQFEAKLQSTQRKLTQTTNSKFTLEKKNQQQSIQIISLNSIIKQLNSKLFSNNQSDSPLRNQFNKLLETNSLLQRQNQSLKAMNEGLQAQIQTLKYQKDQFETNNKQKHDLIQRQIQQRNHLLEQINKNSHKQQLLKQETDKLKGTLQLQQEQTLKARKNYEDLLEQKNQEVLHLRKQIQELYKQSREYHQIRFSFDKLQKQHKELARKSVKMGETLTHLWSVKQAEYQNINQVLGLLKNNQAQEPQNSAHF